MAALVSKWRKKYKTLKQYYKKEYDSEFYKFDQYQLTVDPDETLEDLNKYTPEQQQDEIIKCRNSFAYFCHKYIKVLNPKEGLMSFILYKYQNKCYDNYQKHRFNIISKFRQGGLTTMTLVYGMWMCLFQLDQQILFLSKTDREATDAGMMVDRARDNLPDWLKPNDADGKWNGHLKQFTETGGDMKFHSPEAARGKSITFLIIDEAAFIDNMEDHWKAMFPVMSVAGRCAVISTVCGTGNWYYSTYKNAEDKRNKFNIIDLDYWEHPLYSEKVNPNWILDQKSQLGEQGFAQEILRSFLDSGNTYISGTTIAEMEKLVATSIINKIALNQWVNSNTVEDYYKTEKGALWMWKTPVQGKEYITTVDAADGVGAEGDNSCIEVFDLSTMEQVAEFYSNSIPPHELAQIAYELATFYNIALLVVEDMAAGGTTLNTLQYTLYYENLYYDPKKPGKPGVKVGPSNRNLIIQALNQKILNKTIRINSARLTSELRTFMYNPVNKKAEAKKGYHDDAIMACALACFVKEDLYKDMPVGMGVKNKKATVDTMQEFRKQLRAGLDQFDFEMNNDEKEYDPRSKISSQEQAMLMSKYRKKNTLLKEFNF